MSSNNTLRQILIGASLAFALPLGPALAGAAAGPDPALVAAIDGPHRTAAWRERDKFRHPLETLSFFGLRPDMTVVELWPGGGWYTEILAPFLKDQGQLYAAHFDPNAPVEFYRRLRTKFEARLTAEPEIFGGVVVTTFDPPKQTDIAPPGSADAVLTFRNVHNWYMRGGGQERLSSAFAAMHRALKPGGILGLVDHRLPAGRPLEDQDSSGYMLEETVIQLAQEAGFRLLARTDINANPLDSADYPKGVWALPPVLAAGEQDIERYLTIGESDRMTLKFIKR